MARKMRRSNKSKQEPRGRGRPPKGDVALSATQHVRLTPELAGIVDQQRQRLAEQLGKADKADAIRALMQAGAHALGYLQQAS